MVSGEGRGVLGNVSWVSVGCLGDDWGVSGTVSGGHLRGVSEVSWDFDFQQKIRLRMQQPSILYCV